MPTNVARVIGRTPDIDLDIFRELYGGSGVSTFGFDPRVNSSEVARRLRMTRARVAARLAEWSEVGLLQRYDVWPNPALFGLSVASLEVRVADRFAKEAVSARLGLVDGVVAGLDVLGEWLTIQLVAEGAAEIERRAELIRGLAGVAEVGSPLPWGRLEPEHPLSPLDLRIVRVLRRYPKAPLSTVARHVGVSTRTITTRYGRLLDDRSVWFVPVLDFRALAMPVLSLQVQLAEPGDRGRVTRALRRSYPLLLEFVTHRAGPQLPPGVAFYVVLTSSAAAVADFERFARSVAGVASAEVYTMVRNLSFPATFDRLLAEASPVAPGRRRVPAEANA